MIVDEIPVYSYRPIRVQSTPTVQVVATRPRSRETRFLPALLEDDTPEELTLEMEDDVPFQQYQSVFLQKCDDLDRDLRGIMESENSAEDTRSAFKEKLRYVDSIRQMVRRMNQRNRKEMTELFTILRDIRKDIKRYLRDSNKDDRNLFQRIFHPKRGSSKKEDPIDEMDLTDGIIRRIIRDTYRSVDRSRYRFDDPEELEAQIVRRVRRELSRRRMKQNPSGDKQEELVRLLLAKLRGMEGLGARFEMVDRDRYREALRSPVRRAIRIIDAGASKEDPAGPYFE